MDAAAALERLRDISSQVRAAVIFERGGKVIGSTLAEEERAKQVAEEAEALLTAAEQRGEPTAKNEFAQLEAALQGGSVFVVRDGKHVIAATTPPEPTVGLVFYDLKSALRELEGPPSPPPRKRAPAKRKPAPRKKKPDAKP
jgi:predicted regulator of Ras-like GTPase activity (Roadblock/LC7/MglB family)